MHSTFNSEVSMRPRETLLRLVHPRGVDDARRRSSIRKQVQEARDRLAFERNLDSFDRISGDLRTLIYQLVDFVPEADFHRVIVIEDRVLGESKRLDCLV